MKYYVLYNPAAGRGEAKAEAERLSSMITDGELVYEDLTTYDDGIDELLSRLEQQDKIILCGNGKVIRFSHEDLTIIEEWQTLPLFIVDAINNE